MASKKFEFSTFFDFVNLEKDIYKSIELMELAEMQIKDMAKLPKIKLSGGVADLKANNVETQKLLKLSEAQLKLDKLKNQTDKTAEALAQSKLKTKRDIITTEQKEIANKKKLTAETKKQVEAEMSLEQILKLEIKTEGQLAEQTRLLGKYKKDVRFETTKGKADILKINKAIDSNNKLLEKNADRLKKQKIGIGGYTKGIMRAAGALLPMGLGLSGIISGFKSIVGISSIFEAQMSKVAAISGATNDEFKMLAENAKELGSSTKFTATEVGTLQEVYAKLGFSTTEILNSTAATLDLAAATGEDLATSASVAGATLRGYGLDAKEMGRITNVMAAAFSSSALDLENFTESMKLIAPIAKAANIPVETTTALLGKLADAGLKGSIAGTSLKNLLSKLTNENSKLSKSLGFSVKNSDDLQKAFAILKDRNIDLSEATELTDERSKAAFLTLIDQADAAVLLEEKITGTTAANEMAATMMDNLAGDTDKAASALEGLAINLGSGLNPASRVTVQIFTAIIDGINSLFGQTKKINNEFEELGDNTKRLAKFTDNHNRAVDNETESIEFLFDALRKTNAGSREREDLINRINSNYGTTLKNISDEKKFTKQLNTAQKSLVSSMKEKLFIQAKEEEISKIIKAQTVDTFALALAQAELENAIKGGSQQAIDLAQNRVDNIKGIGQANEDMLKKIDLDYKDFLKSMELNNKKLVNDNKNKNEIIEKEEEETFKNTAENIYKIKSFLLESLKDETDAQGNALISTEEYYARRIELEKELLQAQLSRLTVIDFDKATEDEKAAIEDINTQIAILDEQLTDLGVKGEKSGDKMFKSFDPVHELFTLFTKDTDLTDEALAGMEQAFIDSFNAILSSATEIFSNINELQKERLENELSVIQEGIDGAQSRVDKDKELLEQGKANNLENSEAELQILKDQETEKIKQIEEIEKREREFAAVQTAIRTALTVTNMILAASEAIKGNAGVPFVGVAIGLAAAATAIAGFFAIKNQLSGGLHDGTEFVDGPAGHDNAGVFKLEKGERVMTSDQNKDIPKKIKNKDIPQLVNTALALETMSTPTELLTVIQERQPDNSELTSIMKKMYEQNQNREEIQTIKGRSAKVSYRNGRINSITYM